MAGARAAHRGYRRHHSRRRRISSLRRFSTSPSRVRRSSGDHYGGGWADRIAGPDWNWFACCERRTPLFLAVNKVDSGKAGFSTRRFSSLGHEANVPNLRRAWTRELTICWMGSWKSCRPLTARTRKGHSEPRRKARNSEAPERAPMKGGQDRYHRPPQCGQIHSAELLDLSDRAIVSPIPGTTRDAIDEVSSAMAGSPLHRYGRHSPQRQDSPYGREALGGDGAQAFRSRRYRSAGHRRYRRRRAVSTPSSPDMRTRVDAP